MWPKATRDGCGDGLTSYSGMGRKNSIEVVLFGALLVTQQYIDMIIFITLVTTYNSNNTIGIFVDFYIKNFFSTESCLNVRRYDG